MSLVIIDSAQVQLHVHAELAPQSSNVCTLCANYSPRSRRVADTTDRFQLGPWPEWVPREALRARTADNTLHTTAVFSAGPPQWAGYGGHH